MNNIKKNGDWSSKEYIKERLNSISHALRYATPELKDDKEFALDLLKNHYSKRYNQVLRYCSIRLKNDREVVLAALKHDWHNIKYASKELQVDNKVVDLVYKLQYKEIYRNLKINKHALKNAEETITSNKKLMLALTPFSPYIFQYCSENLRNDPELALKTIEAHNNTAYVQLHLGQELKKETFGKDLTNYLSNVVLYEKLESTIKVKKESPKKLKI